MSKLTASGKAAGPRDRLVSQRRRGLDGDRARARSHSLRPGRERNLANAGLVLTSAAEVMLLGPIVAQLVTVSASERSEVRAVAPVDTHAELGIRPQLGIDVTQHRLHLQLVYGPSLTVIPLDRSPRELLVLHFWALSATYAWRRTALTVSQSTAYGEQNFRVLATSGTLANGAPAASGPGTMTGLPNSTPAPGSPQVPNGMPTTPGAAPQAGPGNSLRVFDQTVRYITSSTMAGVTHAWSPALSLSANAGYTISGAVEAKSRADYPLVQGPVAMAALRWRMDRTNSFNSSITGQYSSASGADANAQTTGRTQFAPNGGEAWLIALNEMWDHRFGVRTASQLGAGLSGGRTSRDDGYIAYTIYPTFTGNLSYTDRLSPGSYTLMLGVNSAPVFDLVTLTIDPRITVVGSAAVQRQRFGASISGYTAFSTAGQEQSALSSVGGSVGTNYRFADAFSMDAGVRFAWQDYGGLNVLPFTYAGFIGMNIALSAPLR